MKYNIKNIFAALLWASLMLAGASAFGQTPDLQALVSGGKINIRVKNSATMDSYFVVGANGKVDLSFYFGHEDPRNGVYYGQPAPPQSTGQIDIRFAEIPYQTGDALNFFATEEMGTGTVRNYPFVGGGFSPSGGPVNTCPIRIDCNEAYIYLIFPPSFPVDQNSLTDVDLFMPGLINNAHYTYLPNSSASEVFLAPPLNAIALKQSSQNSGYIDCQKLKSGQLVVMINGLTCTYQYGQLSSSNNCSPWEDYYNGNTGCAGIFENCAPELIEVLSEVRYNLACKQWIDYGQCSTVKHIKRLGQVAIGTSGFSYSKLTVKNGIITDKVKVTNTGWADYVLEDQYPLMPLPEVEAYIEQYHHLPDTPSGAAVEAEGSFELGETTVNHQVKIEEVFLHLIALEKETDALEALLFLQEHRSTLQRK